MTQHIELTQEQSDLLDGKHELDSYRERKAKEELLKDICAKLAPAPAVPLRSSLWLGFVSLLPFFALAIYSKVYGLPTWGIFVGCILCTYVPMYFQLNGAGRLNRCYSEAVEEQYSSAITRSDLLELVVREQTKAHVGEPPFSVPAKDRRGWLMRSWPSLVLLGLPAVFAAGSLVGLVWQQTASSVPEWPEWLRITLKILLSYLAFAFVLQPSLYALTIPVARHASYGAVPDLLPSPPRGVERKPVGRALLEHERNDIQLIEIETSLATMLRRVDTYTLESSLFGALSFSAFVQLITRDVNFAAQMEAITRGIFMCSDQHYVGMCLPTISEIVVRANLASLVSVLLLSASVFFACVLIARLRFNDGYQHAERAMLAAKSFNNREEELMNRVPEPADCEDTRAVYTFQINQHLRLADEHKNGLMPNIRYMRAFREIGLFLFVLTLATCGYYFSVNVAYLFIVIFVLAFTYGWVEAFFRGLHVRRLLIYSVFAELAAEQAKAKAKGKPRS